MKLDIDIESTLFFQSNVPFFGEPWQQLTNWPKLLIRLIIAN